MGIPSHAIISFEKTKRRYSRRPASEVSSKLKRTGDKR